MMRREFIAGLGGVAAWPRMARAQQPRGRLARIAFLGLSSPSTTDSRQLDAFKEGLRDNGLIEGSNLTVDYVWAEGRLDRLPELADNLAKRNLDVIVTAGRQSVSALMATRSPTPIVFAILGDPVGYGVVASLARPGGGVTGLSMLNTDLESKRIQILKEAAPALTRIIILYDESNGRAQLAEAEGAARALTVDFDTIAASDPDQFEKIFGGAISRGADGIAVMASPFLHYHRKRLIELAALHRLPSVWEGAAFVRDGGLLSYGPNFPDMYRQSARYVAKILNGAKPADLPVEQPTKFELAINLQIAKGLGLSIPPTLLARADEVIE